MKTTLITLLGFALLATSTIARDDTSRAFYFQDGTPKIEQKGHIGLEKGDMRRIKEGIKRLLQFWGIK